MKRGKSAGICIATALLAAVLWTGTIFAAGKGTLTGEWETAGIGWEEEYTDTDTSRGTLSIRCQTFQGFHGTVDLYIRTTDGGWEKRVTLTEGGRYALNLSLPEADYQITEVEAQTDGRQYSSHIREKQLKVLSGKIVMCQISITPDSVYRLPYEESDGEDKTLEDAHDVSQKTAETGEESPVLKPETESVRKSPNFFAAVGTLVLAGCFFCICFMIRQKNEGG